MNKKRKDIFLTEDVIARLQKLADKDKRSLKNYMELVLINHSKQKQDENRKGN